MGLGSKSPFTTIGYGSAWNGLMWVEVGSEINTMAYSFDGHPSSAKLPVGSGIG